jgi:hypothetical protein
MSTSKGLLSPLAPPPPPPSTLFIYRQCHVFISTSANSLDLVRLHLIESPIIIIAHPMVLQQQQQQQVNIHNILGDIYGQIKKRDRRERARKRERESPMYK